jgi:hypothetical protein
MKAKLDGKKMGILVTEGFEQVELTSHGPWTPDRGESS